MDTIIGRFMFVVFLIALSTGIIWLFHWVGHLFTDGKNAGTVGAVVCMVMSTAFLIVYYLVGWVLIGDKIILDDENPTT